MAEVTMFPSKVEQPNRDKDSGLQGKCLKAVKRNGDSYTVNCKYQKDPKYHHEWSNAEEILKGKTIQCGRPSTHFCSHKTYYGIKGYRNTCPIAGISGTYTQPATLRLFFDLQKKGINSNAKINSVKISFDHRCTGVDVANGRETTVWGPNFSGAKIYPDRKPLTVKIGKQKKILDKNPPLSSKFSSTGIFTFKDVTYQDLAKGIDIIYGNNLETNPGNIYIKNLTATINYNNGDTYIEGSQDKNELYIASSDSCRSQIHFTVEAGYKQGNKKLDVRESPKILQKNIIIETEDKNNIVCSIEYKDDNKTIIATLTDKTNIEGEKSVIFKLKNTNQSIQFKYTAIKRNKPEILIPEQIERNTYDEKITSIVAKNGCCESIIAYADDIHTDENPYVFTEFDIDSNNIILKQDINEFYKKLALLDCGWHPIYFRINNESDENIIEKRIQIIPTQHKFKITEIDKTKELASYKARQNKRENDLLKIQYIKTKELINSPSFMIVNPTHGKIINDEPTDELIDDTEWNNVNINNSPSINFIIGTYISGDYEIQIKEKGCSQNPIIFPVKVVTSHKQYYDEIFVKGEDSTAFDYDYLTALEGDSIIHPIYVEAITLGASYQDIKICTTEVGSKNITGLGQINTLEMSITNISDNDIENLFLELNTIIKDDNENYQVTSNEWLEPDGIFYNFKENFESFNNYNNFISIKNLSKDDDNIDEEDVYIKIDRLNAHNTINLKIPYGSYLEKEVFLQILLFGQPLKLYNKNDCNNEETVFNIIPLRVYDSIHTSMSIEGETDYFFTEIIDKCPNECFETKAITYSIKNIDRNILKKGAETKIINDPRLIPYKFEYNSQVYDDIKKYNEDINGEYTKTKSSIIFDKNDNATKTSIIVGEKIDLYFKFKEYKEIYLHQYTDTNGEVTFFITIPKTTNDEFTVKDLLNYISIEYKGNNYYKGSRITPNDFNGTINSLINDNSKNNTLLRVMDENQIKYHAGQTIPLKINLKGEIKYMKNDIIFMPKILKPGQFDKLTVYYRICNLDKNEGILNTTFKTEDYQLVPNEVSKDIFCGVNTDVELNTRLTKIIVEQNTYNRLYISVKNKKRNNKNVRIYIKENEERSLPEKYEMSDYKIEKGELLINNKDITWNIDYMEKDSVINGYIDFKAEHIGYSEIKTKVKDFIDDMENENKPIFGEDSYKCECRRVE